MENNSKLSVNGEIEQKTNVGRYVASQQRMNLTQVNLTRKKQRKFSLELVVLQKVGK